MVSPIRIKAPRALVVIQEAAVCEASLTKKTICGKMQYPKRRTAIPARSNLWKRKQMQSNEKIKRRFRRIFTVFRNFLVPENTRS